MHKAGNPMLTTAVTTTDKLRVHSGRTIPVSHRLMNLSDHRHQHLILLRATTRLTTYPRLIAAGRYRRQTA